MQRGAYHSGMIAGRGHGPGDLAEAEVLHSLSRCAERMHGSERLRRRIHVAFHPVLEIHEAHRVVSRNVVRFYLHDYPGIGETTAASGVGHAVHHHGAVLCGRGHKYASGTHAEREHSPAVDLLDERILRRGHARLPLPVVLVPVDLLLRMLDPHAHGEALRLQRASVRAQHLVDIPCGMPGGEYHPLGPVYGTVGAFQAESGTAAALDRDDPGAETVFPALPDYELADVLDYRGKLV